MAALARFSGTQRISTRSTSATSNATRVRAAVDSVAYPCPAASARIQ